MAEPSRDTDTRHSSLWLLALTLATTSGLAFGEPSLSFSPPSLSFSVVAGAAGANPQQIDVNSTTGAPVTFMVFASSGDWLSIIEFNPHGGVAPRQATTPFSFGVFVSPSNLKPGTYTGTITVISSDAVNNPQMIPVFLYVGLPPTMSAVPSSVDFTAITGFASQTKNVTLSLSDSSALGIFTASIATGRSWLSVNSGNGTLPGKLSVTANPVGLLPGNYSGSVLVSVIGAANNPLIIPVSLTVPAAPTLSSGVSQLSFADLGTGAVLTQTLNVSATSPVAFTVTSNASWLSITPGAGTLPASFKVSATPTTLNPGNYTGVITINAPGAANSPLMVSVALTVSVPPPVLLSVANAFGDVPLIAPNTWVEIKGTGLAPPGDSRNWQPLDFVGNQLPTQLDGVSATVNGKSAFVYSISPAQVNILTPPDPLAGTAVVQLAANGMKSNLANVPAQTLSPSFFQFVSSISGIPYVYGKHATDNSLVGPATLFPGSSSPVRPGEIIYVAGTGFGVTSMPVVSGSEVQSGTLPTPWPAIQIGGIQANVTFAGVVAPGTYQFNVVVPTSLPDGDLPFTATYEGLSTQPSLFLTVQH